jgi:uncharacterized protein
LKHPPLEELIQVFSRYPEIRAAYLFGSQATQKTHPDSDLDIALAPASPELREKKLELYIELARLGFDHVDLVILDNDDIVLKFEAVRYNQLLFASPDHDHPSYYSKIIRQCFDFVPYLEVQSQAYKRRI